MFISAIPIEKCKFGDEKCLVDTVNDIFSKKSGGISEIGLISLDPLKIENLPIKYGGNETLSLMFTFKNVDLIGLSGAECYKLKGFSKDQEKFRLSMGFKAPFLSLIGPYDMIVSINIRK